MNCPNCGSPEWVRSAPTGGIEHVVFECGDSASVFPDGQALKSPSAGVDQNGPACQIIASLREELRERIAYEVERFAEGCEMSRREISRLEASR